MLGTTMDVLVPQLEAIVNNTSDFSKMVIAYEPVWAIGTGLTATPKQAQETHADIRTWLSGAAGADVADAMRIQYGGSANDKNCITSQREWTSTASSSAAPAWQRTASA